MIFFNYVGSYSMHEMYCDDTEELFVRIRSSWYQYNGVVNSYDRCSDTLDKMLEEEFKKIYEKTQKGN